MRPRAGPPHGQLPRKSARRVIAGEPALSPACSPTGPLGLTSKTTTCRSKSCARIPSHGLDGYGGFPRARSSRMGGRRSVGTNMLSGVTPPRDCRCRLREPTPRSSPVAPIRAAPLKSAVPPPEPPPPWRSASCAPCRGRLKRRPPDRVPSASIGHCGSARRLCRACPSRRERPGRAAPATSPMRARPYHRPRTALDDAREGLKGMSASRAALACWMSEKSRPPQIRTSRCALLFPSSVS